MRWEAVPKNDCPSKKEDKELDLFKDGTGKTHLRRLYLEDCLIEAGKRLARNVKHKLDFIWKKTTQLCGTQGELSQLRADSDDADKTSLAFWS